MTPRPGFPALRTAEEAPGPPKQLRSIEKRRKLLEAGRRLFGEKGYAEVSIGEITSNAGTAAGAFYQHFSSKRQFLVVLMNEFLERLAGLDLSPAVGGDVRPALRRFLTNAFRADTAYSGVIRAWQEAALTDAELGRMEKEIRKWTDARVLAVFQRLQKQPNARPGRDLPAFARMMNRHFWSLLARGSDSRRRDFEREIHVAAETIFHYLFSDRPRRSRSRGRLQARPAGAATPDRS
ncbi:MAG: helix-turn-helix domain-containing protein [Thermoanaerobaculia bacterium]